MEQLAPLFAEAGALMLTGMVFVFAFLGLLIIFINTVLAKLAVAYPDAINTQVTRIKKAKNKQKKEAIPAQTVAAISAAVTRYRQQHSTKNNIQ